MIILEEDESQSSERSPLKSPISPVTATRYDSSTLNAPPPYLNTDPSSAQSSHLSQLPQSPVSPYPHSPHPLQSHTHHPHDTFNTQHAGNIHSTTNLPPHIVKMIEEREVRQRVFYRFITSFAIAWVIILIWTTLIRGVTLTLVHNTARNDIQIPDVPPSLNPSYLTSHWWQNYPTSMVEPHKFTSDTGESRSKRWTLDMSVLLPQPSVTIMITPSPVAERILSIAYPPPSGLPTTIEG